MQPSRRGQAFRHQSFQFRFDTARGQAFRQVLLEWLALFVERDHFGRTRNEFVQFVVIGHGLEWGNLAEPGSFMLEVCTDMELVEFQCRLPSLPGLRAVYRPHEGFAAA